MNNSMFCVGRIAKTTEIDEETTEILVTVQRTFKNEKGEYEHDTIKVKLNGVISSHFREYVAIGDLVGIKGSIESDGNSYVVNAEKISFLASKSEEKGE